MNPAYLNGVYLPLDQARISPMDRGFLLSDGVYELIPVYRGVMFGFMRHMRRLNHSLSVIQLDNPHTDQEWLDICQQLIQHSDSPNLGIYIQITRGTEMVRNHYQTPGTKATVFAYSNARAERTIETILPSAAISLEDLRWSRCDIKSISLLPNIMARQQAHLKGCNEALLIRNGTVNEGASSNVFIVKAGTIYTPPLSQFILPGITREVIIELAKKHHIPLSERTFSLEELYAADEVWISSALREIQPIVTVDDRTIGTGLAGPLWHKMIQLYYQYIQE